MTMPRTKLGWALLLIGVLIKATFAAAAVALPLFGVWIASSLAAHHDGPLWASLVAGGLCFPLLPLGWDLFASWRRTRAQRVRPRVLTLFDRLILRTLAINVVFVGSLLALFPGSVFEALSTRGDWMLAGSQAPWAESARGLLFQSAERLSWLHEATHHNAYEELIDPSLTRTTSDDGQPPRAGETRSIVEPSKPSGPSGPSGPSEPSEPSEPAVAPNDLLRTDGWPFAPTLHPAVAALPPEHEASIDSVARYIAQQETDPVQRVKALHDYVADRVAYDVPALRAGKFPPQDAESVFQRRTAVCAGSAALLAALGKAAGVEIVVVVGDGRDSDGLYDGTGHAWNAINLDGRWYLADPTWDAGHVTGDTFVKDYGTDYLLTPPEVFVADHMPKDPQWQLLDSPLSSGDFIRQPHLEPAFSRLGLRLVEPSRARHAVKVGQSLQLRFDNPHGFAVVGSVRELEEQLHGERCQTREDQTEMVCELPEAGRRVIALFGPKPDRDYLGQIYVDVG